MHDSISNRRTAAVVALARAYARYSPIMAGKSSLRRLAARELAKLGTLEVRSAYGTRMRLRFPEDSGYEFSYAVGRHEAATSQLCTAVLRPGDTVLDVGANIGWYTNLFARLVSPGGRVVAFEPVPSTFERLKENCRLNAPYDESVMLERVAVGVEEGTEDLLTFEGRPHGETSARPIEGETVGSKVSVRTTALGAYIGMHNVGTPTLIKVDVEGYEMRVLKGAMHLLTETPPMWIFEVNMERAETFGWSPADLMGILSADCECVFLCIRGSREYRWIDSPDEIRNGDNLFVIPRRSHGDRLSQLARLGRRLAVRSR